MCRKNVKKIKFVAIRRVLSSSKCTKTSFRPELCPGPLWGSLRVTTLHQTPSRLGMETPPPHADLDVYGASILRPRQNKIPGNA